MIFLIFKDFHEFHYFLSIFCSLTYVRYLWRLAPEGTILQTEQFGRNVMTKYYQSSAHNKCRMQKWASTSTSHHTVPTRRVSTSDLYLVPDTSFDDKTGFLQDRENWTKSGNLSGQGKSRKGQGKYFCFGKVRENKKIGATRCKISRLKCIKFDWELTALPRTRWLHLILLRKGHVS